MLLVSMAVFVALTAMAMHLGGGIDMYFDLPSVLIVLPPAVIFTISATSWRHFIDAFTMLSSNRASPLKISHMQAQQVFCILGNSALSLGLFMTLVGAAAIGSNLTAQDFAHAFGPSFAVCILTLIYGLALKLMCYVAEQKIRFQSLS